MKYILAAAVALLPAGAQAATVYDAGGWCRENCSHLGMAEGDRFDGSMTVAHGQFDEHGSFTGSIDFEFHFPAFIISRETSGFWDLFAAVEGEDHWRYEVGGLEFDPAIDSGWFLDVILREDRFAYGSLHLQPISSERGITYAEIAPIPLPAAGWLLLAGLGGLGLLRYRRPALMP